MGSSPAGVQLCTSASSTADNITCGRRAFLVLAAIALIYAFLAGLRTASDFDLGWQMATGRWVLQHHSVPLTDVLSYTAAGEPWTYPVGAGIIFYLAYQVGGYVLISWIGALACVGTIALLLRRGSAVAAAIAILSVPLIALRTTPRADMYTVVLFAAFLSLLFEHHQTGRAALWLLPLLMLAWVNLHFGFAAGLALMLAYIGAELLAAILDRTSRPGAIVRLRVATPWLMLTLLVTLVNPWGLGIYRALLRQERANQTQQLWIAEWTRVPLSWTAIRGALWLRQSWGAIYLLLAIAMVAAVIALLRTQLAAAILLLLATYPAVHYARMGAVFACVVVVVAAPLLSTAITELSLKFLSTRVRAIALVTAVTLLVLLASLRGFDLITNRHYLRGTDEAVFGPGISWWFPQRAAEFVEREQLPGQIFDTYNEGGYLAWRLGPQRLVYIDGRDTLFGPQRIRLYDRLLRKPDLAEWEREAARYDINTLILPLGRYDGIQLIHLQDFCSSKIWQPVYLDEISVVLVRQTPETAPVRQRFPVNCAGAALPAHPPPKRGTEAFNSWSNAAAVLAALDRNSEALSAIDNALDIFPDSAFAHWQRGSLLSATGRLDESEREFLIAVSLEPSDVTWSALADYYRDRGRVPEAIDDMKRAAALSTRPYSLLLNVGYLYLKTNQPEDALRMFVQAERSAPRNIKAADNGTFDFMLAQGRSVAWDELGDLRQAIVLQERAAQIEFDTPEPWRRLAKLYRRQGRLAEANRAEENAATNTK